MLRRHDERAARRVESEPSPSHCPRDSAPAGNGDDWRAALREDGDRGSLVASLFVGKLADIQRRLTAATWRDPRLSNELERVLREPPWSSDTSRPVWNAIFALVSESKDPRFVELAKELPPTWTMRTSQKQWLTLLFDGRTGKALRKGPRVWDVAFLADGRVLGAFGQSGSGMTIIEL